ncbi:putative surface protein with fasciclin (FAS1) repeats [Brevundimonas vesicularis]|uniref:fasciclin domain-containing protein n=1 Tax=Brevundimonas vesicularis TaxID=41276 RepID=UPI00277E4712|nr:fasciclin domain-containing protein [Brevundimonas vesicularis]MDQ1193476.1 putative surface protein with fasciclin (FAS1) repeats [Brevundimonas vesicularis]
MLRAKLLAATAVVSLMAAPAFAQDMTAPATTTTPAPATMPQTDPAMPAMPQTPASTAEAAATPTTTTTAEATTPVAGETVVDKLKASGQFTTLLAALDAAQLTDTLASRPAISIFAPTDAAFAAVPEAERTRLMDPANAAELRQLLLYHVIVADVTPDQIMGKKGGVETAAESQVLLDGTGSAIKADGATVVSAELDASNGAIFPIDKVLNPANSMAAMGDEEAAAPAETAAPAAEATTAAEATPAPTAPNGQPAAMTTTTSSSPVVNPTDGQVDTPATPPVDAADPAADDAAEAKPTPN